MHVLGQQEGTGKLQHLWWDAKERGNAPGEHPVVRTPGDDVRWMETACTWRRMEMLQEGAWC